MKNEREIANEDANMQLSKKQNGYLRHLNTLGVTMLTKILLLLKELSTNKTLVCHILYLNSSCKKKNYFHK